MSQINLKHQFEGLSLDEALDEMVSAEDFLGYFAISYDQTVVHVNRLHIMQRYHDYLHAQQAELDGCEDELGRYAIYRHWLARAYQDFVSSDALTEKVFKVFHRHEPQTTFVSIDDLLK